MLSKSNYTLVIKMTLLILFSFLFLIQLGCSAPQGVGDDTTIGDAVTTEPPATVSFAENGHSDYVVIFSMGGDSFDYAYNFTEYFAVATGISLKYKADAQIEATDDAREIVIGSTDRNSFFDVDTDGIVADGYLIKLADNRLLIYATTPSGYLRAFSAFFKQAMEIEDINNMQKPTDTTVALPENFIDAAPPSIMTEQSRTLSGHGYRTEGYTSSIYNYCTFGQSLTYHFDSPIGNAFNFYTLSYTCNQHLRGELTYTRDGKIHTEVLFLEPGDNVSFKSFCDGAVDGESVAGISSLTLTPIKAKSAQFMLIDISVADRSIPADVVYITDGKLLLGTKLSWGGGVSYLEDLADGDDSITNLLNDHDTGRLIQQSYYGINSAPYNTAKYGDNVWPYNPVQGGDQHNNHSKLIDFSLSEDGKSVYVKCQPLDWAHNNSCTPSYMENTYTIENGYIRVDNRFVDFSGYSHRSTHQELPAFYTISYLSDFVFYNGTSSWTGGELTVKRDLPFWAGNANAYFTLRSDETWGAWVAPSGYGIGVYTPNAEILLAGRYLYNGSKSANSDATNYVAPLITYKLKTLEPFEYSYYITTGSVDSIRGTFESVWRADN